MDLKGLEKAGINPVREIVRYSFGDRATCERLFYQVFGMVDKTVEEIVPLPEYEEIIDWMIDTRGKGLILSGDCGRGKTTILTSVLPVLFYNFHMKVLRPIHAEDIPSQIGEYLGRWAYCIDEVGVEPLVNNYGEKYEGFTRLISEAESKLKPVFITTNITGEDMLKRYGERTVDRVIRLCRPVKFHGDSLRR